MALEMQTFLAQELQERADRSAEVPRELQELEARLERLRRRLADGDPDITPVIRCDHQNQEGTVGAHPIAHPVPPRSASANAPGRT
jgi:hypothetical protein